TYSPTVGSTTTYYVNETSGVGCQGPASLVTATVYPAQTVTAGPAQFGCATVGLEVPGLDVRAWQNDSAGDIDGARYDLYHPSPAPNDSTYLGTIGYATQPIYMPAAGP